MRNVTIFIVDYKLQIVRISVVIMTRLRTGRPLFGSRWDGGATLSITDPTFTSLVASLDLDGETPASNHFHLHVCYLNSSARTLRFDGTEVNDSCIRTGTLMTSISCRLDMSGKYYS